MDRGGGIADCAGDSRSSPDSQPVALLLKAVLGKPCASTPADVPGRARPRLKKNWHPGSGVRRGASASEAEDSKFSFD